MGMRRRLSLAGFSHFTLELCHNFLPIIYPLLIVSLGLSFAQIGTIALLIGLTTSLPQPFLGALGDRFGATRVSGLSILWLGGLMACTGLMPNYLTLLALVGLASLGSAAYHPSGAVLASRSGRRRGAGMSIFSVGGNLGSAISPLLLALLVPFFGLRATLIVLPIALVAGITLVLQQPRSSVQRAAQSAVSSSGGHVFKAGLILLVFAAMTRAWFQVSLNTYLPLWIESQGGTLAQASALLLTLSLAIGFGSLIGGTLSDRINVWYIVIAGLLLLAPAYWLFLSSAGLLRGAALALVGVTIGISYPTFLLMAQDCWHERAGVASGLIMGIGWAPGGLGASLTGLIADRASLSVALWTLMVPALLGLLTMAFFIVTARARRPALSTIEINEAHRADE